MKYLLLLFSVFTFAQNQKFIPLDEETLEFIAEVNYTLYSNNKPIYASLTSKDSITRLPNTFDFDSISFNKLNYKETGFKKEELTEVVLISKKVYELNEVLIVNINKEEFIIGENARFIKRQARPFFKNLHYGLLFKEIELKNKLLNQLVFFVEKVKYKTTYKIKFYAVEELGNPITNQTLKIGKVLFESSLLTLEKGTKNKVEVDLENFDTSLINSDILVSIELQNYYDDSNNKIQPDYKKRTKLKFQLSKKLNYYSRMYDTNLKESTKDLFNMNLITNYDFAFALFEKPHKSLLVAPAIIFNETIKKKD